VAKALAQTPPQTRAPFKFGKELGIFALLVVLCIVVSVMNPRFLGIDNLQNTGRLIGMYGIFSLGIALVIITGGIEMSVGSMFALLGVLLAIALTEKRWNPVVAIVAMLALSSFLGAVHGFLVARVRLQPFVVTLCGLLFYRGLARFIANDETKGFGNAKGFESLKEAASGSVLGVPTPFILFILLAIVVGIVLHKSVYGRYLYAVGRNEEAARYSGIETRRVIATAYVLAGFLAGISGILIAFYTNSVSPSTHGNLFELYGIAAAVLGGCSLRGGEGSVIGVILGTVLLQVLQNLVNLLGIPSSLNFAVMGAVILLGVIADRVLRREKAK
jgi:ribose transport system permease protein